MLNSFIHFENEAGFRTLFQHATLGIIVIDVDGRIIIANPYSESLFGYDSEELVGKSVQILVPETYRSGHDRVRAEYFLEPNPREMGAGKELFGLKKDGLKIPVAISLSHYELESSQVAVAFITDITAQKLNTEKLEHEVALRTEQLEKLLDNERSLNDLKSKFIGIASHEFRTPLSTILSSTGLIERYIEKGDVEAQLKHITRIKSSVQNLNTILTDFLSLEKLDEGMVINQPQLTNIDHFLQEIILEMDHLKKEDQDIEYRSMIFNKEVWIDQNLVKACMVNLISNAIKYSEKGKRIFIDLELNDMVTITVKDEGIGIPRADQEMLFSRFFRASNVGNKKGTGLGLNIVRKYVEIMGGSISCRSKEGAGSSFELTIPITENHRNN